MRTVEKYDILLSLIRLGIGHQPIINHPLINDWGEIKRLADEQGVAAVVLDGLDLLTSYDSICTLDMPQVLRLEWIGEVMKNYEQRYTKYEKAIGSLAEWHNQHGFKMMVLKGYSCSLDWPIPKHRPCGDIDIWQFGKQEEADVLLSKEKQIKIDNSHHHHTIYFWENFMVENHYDFVNRHGHRINKKLEDVFKKLGEDYAHSVLVNGEQIYLPSPNLHALFLMRHLVAHFVSVNITIRQVLDWAFFVKNHNQEVDWGWFETELKKYNFEEFANCINAICVGDLGFPVTIFPKVQFKPDLKERVFNDIMCPEFKEEEPKGIFKRLAYKYERWRGNKWKQNLCFKENRWSTFWSGVWSHLLKPSSI